MLMLHHKNEIFLEYSVCRCVKKFEKFSRHPLQYVQCGMWSRTTMKSFLIDGRAINACEKGQRLRKERKSCDKQSSYFKYR